LAEDLEDEVHPSGQSPSCHPVSGLCLLLSCRLASGLCLLPFVVASGLCLLLSCRLVSGLYPLPFVAASSLCLLLSCRLVSAQQFSYQRQLSSNCRLVC
jgi:hypothetical protein